MSPKPIRAGIIGAGNIAWRYDGGRYDGRRSVSHAACYDRHPGTVLVALCDPDQAALDAAQASIGQDALVTTTELDAFLAEQLDIVSICSPSALHPEHILAAARTGARYLWIEKPVAIEYASFEELMAEWARLPAPPRSHVNYMRRALPQYRALRALPRERIRQVQATYSRTLSVNGVHMVDMVGFALGITAVPELGWLDGRDLQNPSFGFDADGIAVTIEGINLPYHCIELRITSEDGRLSVLQGGLLALEERMEPNPDYPGFFHLSQPAPLAIGDAAAAMRDATYLNLCALLDESQPPLADLESSRFTQGILHKLAEALT